MSTPAVSIHPYFKIHPGKMEVAKALLPKFVEITKSEAGCLYYEFTINNDIIFCREAYKDGDATLVHLQNVGALIEELLKSADVHRLELHGPAAELEKLKGPMAALQPTWFAFEIGV
jgi:quinol monooxygenase YgiN